MRIRFWQIETQAVIAVSWGQWLNWKQDWLIEKRERERDRHSKDKDNTKPLPLRVCLVPLCYSVLSSKYLKFPMSVICVFVDQVRSDHNNS